MIRRHTASKEAKDSTDEGSLGAAKNVVYVVIIATVVIWLAPALLLGGDEGAATYVCNDDGSVTVTATRTTTTGSGSTSTTTATETVPAGKVTVEHRLACAEAAVAASAMIIVDIFRYVLIVASIASVGILRVAPPRYGTPTLKRHPEGRAA